MKAIVGDITKVKEIDVIVNAANGCGIMGAGVAGAIGHSGGQILRDEARSVCKNNIREPGQLYITDAGLLKGRDIKYVYHAVVMKYPGSLTSLDFVAEALGNTMTTARKNGVRSIAIPGLGTGIGGLDKTQVAQRMAKILQSFESNMEITVIDTDKVFIEEFQKSIQIEDTHEQPPTPNLNTK